MSKEFIKATYEGLFELKKDLCQRLDGKLPCNYCINCELIEDLIESLPETPRNYEGEQKE